MHGLPASLTKRLSSQQLTDVTRWWRALSGVDRRSLRLARAQVVARFVEPGATADDANPDFFEYLVNHEISLEDGTRRHICTAHSEARDVIRAGVIPAGFRCPRTDPRCPLRALAEEANGRDVRFSLAIGVLND